MARKTSSPWFCPICGRHFTRMNQIHNCERYSIKHHHLKNIPPDIIQIYDEFVKKCSDFGPSTLESLKNIIALKKNSQFSSIQVQKSQVKVIFRLYSKLESARISNWSQQADRRYYYEIKIKTLEDLDQELISWLKLAYIEN